MNDDWDADFLTVQEHLDSINESLAGSNDLVYLSSLSGAQVQFAAVIINIAHGHVVMDGKRNPARQGDDEHLATVLDNIEGTIYDTRVIADQSVHEIDKGREKCQRAERSDHGC